MVHLYVEYYAPDGKCQEFKDNYNITVAAQYVVDLNGKGIPVGSQVHIKAFVCGGFDKEGSEVFVYNDTASATARYNITGTTLINSLHYEGAS